MENKIQLKSGGIKQQSFEFIFIFYLAFSILSYSFFALYIPSTNIIAMLSFGMLFLRELFFNKLNYKTLLSVFVVICFVGLIWFSNNSQITNPLIALLIFSICARDLNYHRILRVAYYVIMTMLFVIILSSQLGIITDYVANQFGRVRHFLGFQYALYPGNLVLELMLISIYLSKGIKSKIFLIIVDFVIFYYTDSRLAFGLTLISLFLCSEFFIKIVRKIAGIRIFRLFLSSIYVFFTMVSLWISMIYVDSVGWLYELNRLLNYRLELCRRAISVYGITLFGKPVNFTGAAVNANGINVSAGMDYFTVDNGYLDLLIKYGIIAEVIYLAFITYLLYTLLRTENYKLYIIYFIMGVHLLIDFSMLNLIYNVFILLMFYRKDAISILVCNHKKRVKHRVRIVLCNKKGNKEISYENLSRNYKI